MPVVKSKDLVVNQPVVAAAPDVLFEIVHDAAVPLRVGRHTFQLQVTDDSGNVSQPTTVRVVVLDDKAPTAVIDAPTQVSIGSGFTLSAKRSSDIGGKLVKFTWTLIEAP